MLKRVIVACTLIVLLAFVSWRLMKNAERLVEMYHTHPEMTVLAGVATLATLIWAVRALLKGNKTK